MEVGKTFIKRGYLHAYFSGVNGKICLIKYSFCVEPYVKYNLNKRQRSLCAPLQSGTLPLALEIGRFNATEQTLLCDQG